MPNAASVTQQSMAALEDRCRHAGLPVTIQRRAVFNALLGCREHPTADEVYAAVREHLCGLSRTTVYRTLETLVRLGVAQRLSHPGAAARFDPCPWPHYHLVCRGCFTVRNVQPTAAMMRTTRRWGKFPPVEARRNGFAISECLVTFHGWCRDCRKLGRNQTGPASLNDLARNLWPQRFVLS